MAPVVAAIVVLVAMATVVLVVTVVEIAVRAATKPRVGVAAKAKAAAPTEVVRRSPVRSLTAAVDSAGERPRLWALVRVPAPSSHGRRGSGG